MSDENCRYEARVLAARRSGRWEPELAQHLDTCPACVELTEVANLIGGLGSVPEGAPLPDPDVLWIRAQIEARQDAALKALRMSTLRRMLRNGGVAAAAAWLLVDAVEAEGPRFDALAGALTDPVFNAALSAALALGIAALLLGRSLITARLRDLGLL
jgi:hypothetical protein